MQAKILRVLQDHEVDKVGELRPAKVDVRVVAATNRDLEKMVADGEFRDDLYYRLAVVAIRMPPLRERASDIPRLVDHFMAKYGSQLAHAPAVRQTSSQRSICTRGPATSGSWKTSMQRALVLDRDQVIGLDDLPERLRARDTRVARLRIELPDDGLPLEDVERELLVAALMKHDWNQTRAAAYLNISRSTLIYRMQKFGLERPSPGAG